MKNFNKWLDTFLEEKEFDKYQTFEHKLETSFHMVDAGCVIDFIKSLHQGTQNKIKNTLVQIYFRNGDYLDFIKYISNGMVKQKYGGKNA